MESFIVKSHPFQSNECQIVNGNTCVTLTFWRMSNVFKHSKSIEQGRRTIQGRRRTITDDHQPKDWESKYGRQREFLFK